MTCSLHSLPTTASPTDPSSSRGRPASTAAFERRRPLALQPWLYQRTMHQALLRRSSGAQRRWLECGQISYPYFALRASYDTTRAREALVQRGIQVTQLPGYFDRLVGYAVTAQWGRRPLTRVEAAAQASRRRQPRLALPVAHPAAAAHAGAAARHAGQVRAQA